MEQSHQLSRTIEGQPGARCFFIPLTEVVERRLQEDKCGVTAWLSKNGSPVAPTTLGMQDKIVHRGEDAFGVATIDTSGRPVVVARPGRVRDAFPSASMLPVGDRMIGHNRYGTSGTIEQMQPVTGEVEGRWITIAHNGNIPDEYRAILRERIPEEFHSQLTFDSAEIAYAIAAALGENWPEKIANALDGVPMAYALTMLTDTGDIYGMVGPSGHWPLWFGENDEGIGLASETRAFPPGSHMRQIKPGELVHLKQDGATIQRLFLPTGPTARCSLHEVYGAKSDSQRNENETYGDLRYQLGRQLAKEQREKGIAIMGPDVLYVGVPNSGLLVAQGYADELGVKLTDLIQLDGHKKGRRERSFIAQTVDAMKQIAAEKFRLKKPARVKGKRVVMLDDSVIRGTTTTSLDARIKAAGATHVHIISGLPPVLTSCDLGYNIKESQGLLALGADHTYRTHEEMAQALGADSIYFISQAGLEKVLGSDICTQCLDGRQPEVSMIKVPIRRRLTSPEKLVS